MKGQLYVLDDNLTDSVNVYQILESRDKKSEVPGAVLFKLPLGETVKVEGKLKENPTYPAVIIDGKRYTISQGYLLFSDENPEGAEDIFGDTRSRTNHSLLGKFFGTMVPYWIIAIFFIAAILFTFVGLKFSNVRRLALFIVPACILVASLFEIWAAYVMGGDAFWWCSYDRYGFWGSLLRAIPFIVFVAFQLFSIWFYKGLIMEEHPDGEVSLKPMAISIAVCLPATIAVTIICALSDANDTLTGILSLLTFFLSLGIGTWISVKRNIGALGKGMGILFSAFSFVYVIGAIVAVVGLVMVILELILQVILIVAAILGVGFVMGKDSGGSSGSGGGGGGSQTTYWVDEDGGRHTNAVDAEAANKRIAERKAGN